MTGYEMAHQQAEQLFRTVLPSLGMAVREGQIQLCHAMLDALFGRETALCDAGVGLGKTYAYLAAAILWQNQKPLAMRKPIVLSTASVALQDAILKEYIPLLSSALLQYGLIHKPIPAVLRKGKERYACDLRLHSRQQQIALRGERFARRLATLQEANTCLDLDQIAGLSRYDWRRICVPQRCTRDCLGRNRCRYQNYLQVAKDPAIWFQVCNHNYLLADASHRQNGWKPLLQDYGALIIDEAHRLPEANQQMNTRALTLQDLQALADRLQAERLTELTQRLRRSGQRLAEAFALRHESRNDSVPFAPNEHQLCTLADLEQTLQGCRHTGDSGIDQTARRLENLVHLFLAHQPDQIAYIQYSSGAGQQGAQFAGLYTVPNDLPYCLYSALWRREKPAILTSGTLAAGQDFAHSKRQLGLEAGVPVRTLQVPSPFAYAENGLLLFLRPPTKHRYRAATSEQLARQIEQLVRAAHGHTLVLFTSYDQMGHVYEQLEGKLPVPLFKAPRGGQWFVEQFKRCENAVLLAGGPCWEGVDFPGDMVSLLVIVRLPFPVPDPVREARQEQYPNLHTYIQAEIVPEMQQKLRQGFGRAIRTEADSCAVAILDPRAAPGGRYHQAVLEALPDGIPVTTKIEDIESFLRAHKSLDYFLPNSNHN